jgi:hypothetical protein
MNTEIDCYNFFGVYRDHADKQEPICQKLQPGLMSRRVIACRVKNMKIPDPASPNRAQVALQDIVSKALPGIFRRRRARRICFRSRLSQKRHGGFCLKSMRIYNAGSRQINRLESRCDIGPTQQNCDSVTRFFANNRAPRGVVRELESLAAEAIDTPQLLVQPGRGLQWAARTNEAVELLERGVRRRPTDTALLKLLAPAHWQRGDGEHCTRELARAISLFSGELQLRLVAADVKHNAGNARKGLGLLEPGFAIAPDAALLLISKGVLLDLLDRPAEALVFLCAASARAAVRADETQSA